MGQVKELQEVPKTALEVKVMKLRTEQTHKTNRPSKRARRGRRPTPAEHIKWVPIERILSSLHGRRWRR